MAAETLRFDMVRKVLYGLLTVSFTLLIAQIFGAELFRTANNNAVNPISDYHGLGAKIEVRATAIQDNENATSIVVRVSSLEIHVPGGWQPMKLSDTPSFDLLKLNSLEQSLATCELPPGTYTQVKLGINKVMVTLKNGQIKEASMPGSKFTFVMPFTASAPSTSIPTGNATVLVFQFNADDCINIDSNGKSTFQPSIWLRSTRTPGSMEIITTGLPNGEA